VRRCPPKQALREPAPIAAEDQLEVLIGFRTEGGVTHAAGEIVDRNGPALSKTIELHPPGLRRST